AVDRLAKHEGISDIVEDEELGILAVVSVAQVAPHMVDGQRCNLAVHEHCKPNSRLLDQCDGARSLHPAVEQPSQAAGFACGCEKVTNRAEETARSTIERD